MRDHEIYLENCLNYDGTPLNFAIERLLTPIQEFTDLLCKELQSSQMKSWLNHGSPSVEIDADGMLSKAMLFLNEIGKKGEDLNEVLTRINYQLVDRYEIGKGGRR